jgi:hypothetical protein
MKKLYKILFFKDIVDAAIIRLLNNSASGILTSNEIFYDIGDNVKGICSLIRGSLKEHHLPKGSIKTLILGTCTPNENIHLKNVPEDNDNWYYPNIQISFNVRILNHCLRTTFFEFLSNLDLPQQTFSQKNIKFIYTSGFSSRALLQCITQFCISSNSYEIDENFSSILKDSNDFFENGCIFNGFNRDSINFIDKLISN